MGLPVIFMTKPLEFLDAPVASLLCMRCLSQRCGTRMSLKSQKGG